MTETETSATTENQVSVNAEYIGDPRLGIIVYRNMLPKELGLIDRLEKTIGDSETAPYMWMEALVGHEQRMPEYRDCVDCKIDQNYAESAPAEFAEIANIWRDTTNPLTACLRHYESLYNVKMNFMEAINYVRYGVGQHFQVHTDHGFSYVCTISSIMYLNDDYEGGELFFPYFQLKFKPEAGDTLFFPSTFIYAHAALPVTTGVKYSAVTMFDYNDKNQGKASQYGNLAAPRAARGVTDEWADNR